MSRAPKLNATKVAQVRAALGQGVPQADLARRFGVSVGLINGIAKGKGAKASAAPPPRPAVETPHPAPQKAQDAVLAAPTIEDLRAWLGSQVRALQADAEAAPDVASRAAANRSLVAATTLLARVTPAPPPDPNVGVFVEAKVMKDLAATVAERLHRMIDLVCEESRQG